MASSFLFHFIKLYAILDLNSTVFYHKKQVTDSVQIQRVTSYILLYDDSV